MRTCHDPAAVGVQAHRHLQLVCHGRTAHLVPCTHIIHQRNKRCKALNSSSAADRTSRVTTQEAAIQLNTVNIRKWLTLVQDDSLPVDLCVQEGPAMCFISRQYQTGVLAGILAHPAFFSCKDHAPVQAQQERAANFRAGWGLSFTTYARPAPTCMRGEHSMGCLGRHSLLMVSNVAAWAGKKVLC